MSLLKTLRRDAAECARLRGHRLAWGKPVVRGRQVLLDATCRDCGHWVQVDTRPAPNGIDIGGPAVALNCGDPR